MFINPLIYLDHKINNKSNYQNNFECVFPNEIMYIILGFCNIRILKKFKFLKEFSYLKKVSDKNIKKRNSEIEDRNYWKLL